MVAESAEEKRWTIFLCHSNKDKPFVDWLYDKLCSANLTVWYDKYELLVGDAITTHIAEGLKGSDFLIVVISQWAIESNWVKTELKQKILPEIEEHKVNVLPVTLDDTKPEEISPFLKGKKWIRFPREGSDEMFRELLRSIQGHLQRRDQSKVQYTSYFSTMQYTSRNPFGLRGGIEPERFVVPELLVRGVTEDIVKKQSISIVGARMMGKTSLLKFLSSSLCQSYYQDDSGLNPGLLFAYLDLQEHAGKNRDELIPELARVMSEFLPAIKHFQGNTHKEALDWIKHTVGRRKVENPKWVLLFDEFDRVVELNGLDKTLFDELRSLPQHYNLSYAIASCKKLIDLPLPQGASTSPFFNFLKEHFLTVWNESTARKLMFKPQGKELKLFNGDDFDFMTKLTAYHPLLLQIGCYYLFNAHQIDGNKTIDYGKLLHDYLEEAEGIYRYYWYHEINDAERRWLSDCLQTQNRGDTGALNELQNNTTHRKHHTIRMRLAKLGLVRSESGPLEIPTGFQSFLEAT